jgi:hypothetical protein
MVVALIGVERQLWPPGVPVLGGPHEAGTHLTSNHSRLTALDTERSEPGVDVLRPGAVGVHRDDWRLGVLR